ncbi:MAG TPA: hypothetical protein VK066_11495 [Chloroflexota bacterium]|nr:hypothetical protein [Chloroflexota bacterium]
MWQRALIVVLTLPIAAFALWGAWAIARQVPTAPQAALGAVAFVGIGAVALAAGALGARTVRQ